MAQESSVLLPGATFLINLPSSMRYFNVAEKFLTRVFGSKSTELLVIEPSLLNVQVVSISEPKFAPSPLGVFATQLTFHLPKIWFCFNAVSALAVKGKIKNSYLMPKYIDLIRYLKKENLYNNWFIEWD